MTVIITRMPSTGCVTNVTTTDAGVDAGRQTWRDCGHVEVLSDEEYAALPRCGTCGEWAELGRCADCR